MSIDLATLDMSVRPWLPCGTSGDWRIVRVDAGATELRCGGDLWMDDRQSEYEAHREFIEQAEGRILITGLGLGWLPYALFCGDRVQSIDIVERSHDVITLVWRHLRARWPVRCAQDRLNLIVGDARKTDWVRGRKWEWAWHDFTRDPMSDDEWERLQSLYAPVVSQQMRWRGSGHWVGGA